MRPRLVRRDGRLTQGLARVPGGFGLGQVPARLAPESVVPLVCGYCSTGCSLDVHVRDHRPVNLTPSPDYPVNLGLACPKGWEALAPLAADDRATEPLLRSRHGQLQPVGWDEAIGTFVERTHAVQRRHGASSVAFLGTGQLPTEELALLGALAKFGMGMRHGDGNTRQCMATAVRAYKESFGFDAPPYTYADLEASDVLVFVGANPCIAHPILWERVCRNRHDPEIVVVDPRRTETAMAATQHLAIEPKSDLTLLYGLGHLLVARGAVDRRFVDDHTVGFDRYVDTVAGYPPDRVAAATGVTVDQLDRLATTIAEGQRVSFWWTMGVNQSHQGTRTAQAIIDLALLTGNIGRPGTGANSITGQCNAMGSRLFANTTSLLGGHDFADGDHRAKVARLLDLDPALVPGDAGWAYDQIVEGIARGDIRALWVVGTNPAHSWINHRELHGLLERLEFLVVQDAYATTETAERADLVLPAAAWGEKEGTFINSERRVGLVHRVATAPGWALADFAIFKLVADAWGCGERFARWTDPEATFGLLIRLTVGQPCDLTGIEGYDHLATSGGIQWPFPAGGAADGAPERRLFGDGRFFTPDGRARFVVDVAHAPPEEVDDDHPFVLLTGRGSSAQWHTETRTGKSALLRSLSPDGPYVEINPVDARRLGIAAGQWVTVQSRRGRVAAKAFVTPTVGPGQLFLPMHDAATNRLTFPAFDPHSRQPAYKHAAVALRPVALSEDDRVAGGGGTASRRDANGDGGRARPWARRPRDPTPVGCPGCSPGTGRS